MYIASIKEISDIYKIKLIQVESGDKYCLSEGEDNFINRSFIIGSDEIIIGIYDNIELLTASFFHELGHVAEPKKVGFFNSEEDAWIIGFKLAKEYGYTFSESTYEWAKKQLMTYDNN